MAYEGGTQPFEAVSLLDSALDVESMGIETLTEYSRERNPALIREKPGMRLTRFKVARAPNSLFQRYVGIATTDEDRWIRAFQVSVTAIHNLVSQEDGELKKHLEPTESVHTASGDHRVWSEKDLVHVATSYLHEIGRVCWSLGFLPRGSVRSYPLPRTVSDEVEARTAPLAADAVINAVRLVRERLSDSGLQTPPSALDAEGIVATVTARATGSPDGNPPPTPSSPSESSSG